MFGRGIASLLGLASGALIALSGVVAILDHWVSWSAARLSDNGGEAILGAIAALVLGVIVILVSRPRLFWWGRGFTTGLTMLVLGGVAWFALGGGLLTILGAALALLSGVIFVIESRPLRSIV